MSVDSKIYWLFLGQLKIYVSYDVRKIWIDTKNVLIILDLNFLTESLHGVIQTFPFSLILWN